MITELSKFWKEKGNSGMRLMLGTRGTISYLCPEVRFENDIKALDVVPWNYILIRAK